MLTPKSFSDGALMMALYTATAFAKDQIAIAYYSIVLTVITVAVAMAIGFVQMLTLVRNIRAPARFFLIQLQSTSLRHARELFAPGDWLKARTLMNRQC